MSTTLSEQELRPTHPLVQEATIKALKVRIEPGEVQKFLNQATSAAAPAPIGATASVNIAIWGKVKCDPDGQPWRYDTSIWGGPAFFGSGIGFMYTAYDNWDAFFRSVTSVHTQGIISGGGILQINWFNAGGTPVGQFNGVVGGIGALEAGGSGTWQSK